MTPLNSIIISMTTLPLLLTVWYVYFVWGQLEWWLETWTILLELFLYIVLPILGALFLWYSKPLIVEKLLPLVSRFLKIYFAALIIWGSITLFRDFSIVQDYGRSVLWIAVIMITLLYLIWYFSWRSARLWRRSSKTLWIEVAFQNSGLSLSIAITILWMIEIWVPSMVYWGLMSLAALIYVAYERW